MDGRNEKTLPITVPPPLFPNLQFKPQPSATGEKEKYMFKLKQERLRWLRNSSFYVTPEPKKTGTEPHSARHKKKVLHEIEWDESLFPRELFHDDDSPSMEEKKEIDEVKDKMEKLKVLELAESKQNKDDDLVNPSSSSEGQSYDDSQGNLIDEEESMDGEIVDEESDYVESYFDNGENYLDDDECSQ